MPVIPNMNIKRCDALIKLCLKGSISAQKCVAPAIFGVGGIMHTPQLFAKQEYTMAT